MIEFETGAREDSAKQEARWLELAIQWARASLQRLGPRFYESTQSSKRKKDEADFR